MEHSTLRQQLSFWEELDRTKQQQLEEYFVTAPQWLFEAFKIEYMEKGYSFVKEKTPVDKVYFIAKGVIKATDYRVVGMAYDFMKFAGTYAMGGMEVLMDLEYYRTTLETVTPCIMITIPVNLFKKWLETDLKAMKQEAKAVVSYLNNEARQGRAFLLLEGVQRLKLLLVQYYEIYQLNGVYETTDTRQKLAEESGLSEKTVNRAVKKLQEEGRIGRRGSRITVDESQYLEMKKEVSEILDM